MKSLLEDLEPTSKIIGLSLNKNNRYDYLEIIFDGKTLRLADTGRSCCEVRYLYTDDNLPYYVGSDYLGYELLEGPTTDTWVVHEMMFLHVRTSRGVFTVVSHNEHNGYYGGIYIEEMWRNND